MEQHFHEVKTQQIQNPDGSVTTVTTISSGSSEQIKTVSQGTTVTTSTVTTSVSSKTETSTICQQKRKSVK